MNNNVLINIVKYYKKKIINFIKIIFKETNIKTQILSWNVRGEETYVTYVVVSANKI